MSQAAVIFPVVADKASSAVTGAELLWSQRCHLARTCGAGFQ